MYPYRIRLRGPWEAVPLDPPGEMRRVTMPARLGECGLTDCRHVLLRRHFGRPRQIDQHERVWLVGEGVGGRAELHMNAQPVGCCSREPFAFPVTHLIAERNELKLDLHFAGLVDGWLGDFALEIRCRAFLENVRVERTDGGLRVTGQVSGDADGPLDFYVLAGGNTLAYRKCLAGEDFEILTGERARMPVEVRVELVAGAVVWYSAEVAVR
jgi:hypothetical protein